MHLKSGGENKMSKDQCEYFSKNITMNISLTFFKVKYFESTILYNDFQHNILALQGKANKQP